MEYEAIMIIAYRIDFAISNKYFKVIIKCLELEIFNDEVEVLFCKIKKK